MKKHDIAPIAGSLLALALILAATGTKKKPRVKQLPSPEDLEMDAIRRLGGIPKVK